MSDANDTEVVNAGDEEMFVPGVEPEADLESVVAKLGEFISDWADSIDAEADNPQLNTVVIGKILHLNELVNSVVNSVCAEAQGEQERMQIIGTGLKMEQLPSGGYRLDEATKERLDTFIQILVVNQMRFENLLQLIKAANDVLTERLELMLVDDQHNEPTEVSDEPQGE